MSGTEVINRYGSDRCCQAESVFGHSRGGRPGEQGEARGRKSRWRALTFRSPGHSASRSACLRCTVRWHLLSSRVTCHWGSQGVGASGRPGERPSGPAATAPAAGRRPPRRDGAAALRRPPGRRRGLHAASAAGGCRVVAPGPPCEGAPPSGSRGSSCGLVRAGAGGGDDASVGEQFTRVREDHHTVAQEAPPLLGVGCHASRRIMIGGFGGRAGRLVVTHGSGLRSSAGFRRNPESRPSACVRGHLPGRGEIPAWVPEWSFMARFSPATAGRPSRPTWSITTISPIPPPARAPRRGRRLAWKRRPGPVARGPAAGAGSRHP